MELNEAIQYYNNLANDIDKNPLPGDSSSEAKQLTLWLQELKELQQKLSPIGDLMSIAYNNGSKDCLENIKTKIKQLPRHEYRKYDGYDEVLIIGCVYLSDLMNLLEDCEAAQSNDTLDQAEEE